MRDHTIVLEKYIQTDFETFYSLVKEDGVMRYISGEGLTISAAREKFDSIIKLNNEEANLGYFKVFNENSEFIGDCKLEWNKHDRSMLEIGYILKEEFWGRKYGTMICSELLSLADQLWPAKDVIGIIDPDNTASKRLLEKFGFESYFVGTEDDLPTEKLMLKKLI